MRSIALLATLSLASAASAQTTWTVSPFDPSADFVTIQTAVDAASSGDTLLIRLGQYAGFEIDGKGLNLIADSGAGVNITSQIVPGALIRIANLPAGSSVTMRGIRIFSAQVFDSVVGVDLVDNAGEVWLEQVDVQMFHPFTLVVDTLHAMRIQNSATVSLVSCSLDGHRASEGLVGSDSDVFVYGCELQGGPGAPDELGAVYFGGGHGARITSGQLFAADSIFQGGAGMDTTPFICSPATDGGDGARIEGGVFRDRSNVTAGGGGGSGAFCALPDGADGGGTVLAGGTREQYLEAQRGVTSSSPVFEGELSTQVYSGVPSEVVFATIGFTLEPGVFFSEFAGPLLLGPPKLFRFCGLIGAGGTRTKSFTLQELGLNAVTAYFHPSFFDLGTMTWTSGTPSAVTLLDSGFAQP